jgi:glucose/arabinose dehydrogenase
MRNTALVLVLAAACGGGKHEKKDAGPARDGAPPVDAPPLITCTPVSGTNISLRQIGRVSGGAMIATSPPNDGRLFVVEQQGRIRVFEDEQLLPDAFLDIRDVDGFSAGGERGLLGLAFHPDYANNRQFYVFYTTGNANVLAKYTQSASDPNKADPTGEILLSIPDFASNHNGGMMEFGSDGYLYIGTGDGGDGGDPCRNGQAIDRTAAACTSPPARCTQLGATSCEPLLGKILRIDVNTTTGNKKYGIPATNPFANGGGEPEIFVIGVRNPWRWSFDRATGDMWIGDVGQNAIEEITVLKAGEQAGKNLGWSRYEANTCYASNYAGCVPADYNANGFTGPQYQHDHSAGYNAIIGGQVYRGECFPDLKGMYFATDNGAHPLLRGTLAANGSLNLTELTPPANGWPASPASIHADARGELYLTTTAGYVYQIEAGP